MPVTGAGTELEPTMPDPIVIDLSGQTALVTGAGGTIGAGIARRLARAGASVVVHHRGGDEAAAAVARQIDEDGGDAMTWRAELTAEAECAALVEGASAWHGRLDILVNNAAVQPVVPLDRITADQWRALFEADLTAVHVCTRLAAGPMAAARSGSIIQIGSIEGTQPAVGHAHYAAAKAALLMYTRAAALEYGPAGIRVNAVSPGLVRRPGIEEQWPDGVARWRRAAPLGRLGTPDDVADACLFLASPLAAWITGHNLVADGGVSAHPTW
jgi:3-oxoacyl-[acyl-carrier protein] reductase